MTNYVCRCLLFWGFFVSSSFILHSCRFLFLCTYVCHCDRQVNPLFTRMKPVLRGRGLSLTYRSVSVRLAMYFVRNMSGQDVRSRLWNVTFSCRCQMLKNKEKPCWYFFILRRQNPANGIRIGEVNSNAPVNNLTRALLQHLHNVSVIFSKLDFFRIKSVPIPARVWLCSRSEPLSCQSRSTFIKKKLTKMQKMPLFMHHHVGQCSSHVCF